MEINDLVSNSLASIFPRQELTFYNKKIEWQKNYRKPVETVEKITVLGRLQPMNPALIMQLGFNIQENEYYSVYLSDITATQADKIKQMGNSTFEYNGELYQVVGKNAFDTNNWRLLYCYKIEKELE